MRYTNIKFTFLEILHTYNSTPIKIQYKCHYSNMFPYASSQSVLVPTLAEAVTETVLFFMVKLISFSPQINFADSRTSCSWNHRAYASLYKAFEQFFECIYTVNVCSKFLPFFFFYLIISYCVTIELFIHSIDGYLAFFQFLSIMNKTASYSYESTYENIFSFLFGN